VGLVHLASGAGCTTRCRGPGCEDNFRSMVVDGIVGADLLAGERDVDNASSARVVGEITNGTGWSARGVPRSTDLLVGTPQTRQVVRVAPVVGEELSIETVPISWSVDADGFGANVAVWPHPAPSLGSTLPADGFDLWVAAPDADLRRGALYLFGDAHEAEGSEVAPQLVIRSGTEADRLGEHLFACGDLTGDGRPDLVASIPWWQPASGLDILDGRSVPPLAGAVAVIPSEAVDGATGERRPWDLGPVYWGTEAGAGVGPGVACSEDLDGDGLVDLAIGAPRADDQAGAVHMVTQPLPAAGPLDEVSWRTVASPEPAAWFGEALAAYRWDDVPRLVVGAPGRDGGQGAVYLVRPQDDLPLTPFGSYDSSRNNPDHVGREVATADLDGDGVDEIIVGAPDYRNDNRTFGVGRLWVFTRDLGLAPDLEDAAGIIVDTQPFRRLGRDLVVHDLDGDDLPDLWLPTQAP